MSVAFTCPSCKRVVMMERIWPVVDLEANAHCWQCKLCDGVVPASAWGKSIDGTLAAEHVFIYTGAAKNEPFGLGFARAMTRKVTFAASFTSLDKIRTKVDFTSEDGIATYYDVGIWHLREKYLLRGRFYTPTAMTSTPVVMLLSGSGGVAAQYLNKVIHRYLKRVGVRVLCMDYRGFGGSDRKTPSEQGLFTDAEAMYTYLTADTVMGGLEIPMKKVVVHGYSLGTGVATELVRRKPGVGGLVLQCPFTSAAAMGRKQLGAIGEFGGKISAHFDVSGKLPMVTRPVLLLIARQDEGMEAEGRAIAKEFTGKLDMTVGEYDGLHEEPHNAFKDGTGMRKMYAGKDVLTRQPRFDDVKPMRGMEVIKDTSKPHDAPGNTKVLTGEGCIGVIKQWYARI